MKPVSDEEQKAIEDIFARLLAAEIKSRSVEERVASEIIKKKIIEDRENSKQKLNFAFANLSAVGAATGVAALLNAVIGKLDSLKIISDAGINYLSQVHWMIIFSVFILIYGLLCMVFSYTKSNKIILSIFRLPTWTELRVFGNQQVAKISYLALGLIPLFVSFISENPLRIELLNGVQIPLNLKITFFIAFYFSIALLVFIVGCPKSFLPAKSVFEGTKNVNMVFGDASRSVVNIHHEQDENIDAELDNSKIILRFLTWTFYVLGLSYSTVLLFRSARLVVLS